MLVLLACSSDRAKSAEQNFVEREVADLKDAIAKRSESGIAVGCAAATVSTSRVSQALAAEIVQLCYVDGPKVYLENALADVRKRQAEHPELGDLACMQLFVKDAFDAIAKHPSGDAALAALADEYTKLCPDQAAKLRAH